MEPNWSSLSHSPVNDDDISGSMSNTQAGNSDVYGIVAHDGNGMDLDPVPFTQPEPGHAGQALYPTSHYAGPQPAMSSMMTYPDVFSTPEPLIPGGSDYGLFPDNSYPGGSYMGGLESDRNIGMVYGGYQETVFNTLNLDNNNNAHRFAALPPNPFNGNSLVVHGTNSTIPVDTPIYGHADIHAPTTCLGLDLSLQLDPTLTIPTSTVPHNRPLLTLSLLPTTPTTPVITITTPTMVAGNGYNHDYNYNNYISGHNTPTPELSGQETSTSAKRCKNRKTEGKGVYRKSYPYRDSHRYTCDPCRFSTDVKRDFDRHEKTDKHKKNGDNHRDNNRGNSSFSRTDGAHEDNSSGRRSRSRRYGGCDRCESGRLHYRRGTLRSRSRTGSLDSEYKCCGTHH